MRRRLGSIVGGLIAAAVWYALALQLSSQLRTSMDWAPTLFHFFGSFTILTNTLIALVLTAPTLSLSGAERFATPSVRTAAAAYIAIVGAVHVAILREPSSARGAQALTDLILDKLVPLFYVVYWMLFEPHGRVGWRAAWSWLEYPAVYLGYGLVTGALTGWYLYPFMDVSTAGYARVVLGSTLLLLGCLLMNLAVIALDKALAQPDLAGVLKPENPRL
jgi:hypothetical protein